MQFKIKSSSFLAACDMEESAPLIRKAAPAWRKWAKAGCAALACGLAYATWAESQRPSPGLERLSKLPDDTHEIYSLDCSNYDDDSRYPFAPFPTTRNQISNDCTDQDASENRCSECFASDNCLAMCGDATALCDQYGFDGSGEMQYRSAAPLRGGPQAQEGRRETKDVITAEEPMDSPV